MMRSGFYKFDAEATRIEAFGASHNRHQEYATWYQRGLAGVPDPMGLASWVGWQGWRDGAADVGYLPLCSPFGVRLL